MWCRRRAPPCQAGRHRLLCCTMRRSLASLLPWHRPRVPVVELHGLIASRGGALNLGTARPLIERAFGSVARDGTVVLDIECPGGSPVQSDLITALIRR